MPPFLLGIVGKLGIKGMVAIGLGLALLAAFFVHKHDRAKIAELSDWKASTVSATRIAADRPKLAENQVPQQILFLGQGIGKLKSAIANQNADIALRAQAYQDSLNRALSDAERLSAAARQSQGQIDKLRALSAVKGSGQCEVPGELSDALSGL